MFSKIKFLHLFSLFALIVTLSGCDLAENYLKVDREANLERQDFRDGLAARDIEVDEVDEVDDFLRSGDASIPALQPYVSGASEEMKSMPIVSISVNQSVPLRDILFELAEQADYDLELDPAIRGSIIFTARERPFDQVIERISDVAGLRYNFNDNVLRVELDTPYNHTYKIDYLSYVRSNTGNVRNDIAVVSGDGADTGSSFQATSQSEADFWGELQTNLTQLLGGSASPLITERDPRITAVDQNVNVQSVGDDDVSSAVLRVDSLPTSEDDEPEQGNNNGVLLGPDGQPLLLVQQQLININGATFALNQQSGLISVFASERQHKEVAEYLRVLEKAATAQVLIEAKILEVSLNDEFSTGIDWRALGSEFSVGYVSQGFDGLVNNFSSPVSPSGTSIATDSNFVLGYAGNDAQAVIQAISGFGTVRALASPRMTVLNNQSAVLNVATNRVFFEIDIDTTQDQNGIQTDIDSDIRNVPEGILVNVQPSINLENRTVSLALRPTITRVTGQVSDPAVQFIAAQAAIAGIESLVPELNVQEIDSVIRVRSGQPVLMGGLLQDRTTSNEEGVPVLNEMPLIGSLFKQHNDVIQKTELVIFLKATILDAPSDTVHDTDRDIYKSFGNDRRPFKL